MEDGPSIKVGNDGLQKDQVQLIGYRLFTELSLANQSYPAGVLR